MVFFFIVIFDIRLVVKSEGVRGCRGDTGLVR